MPNNPSETYIEIDPDRAIGEISPLLFGGFAEHLGRCVYEGIYDPASPLADEDGLRTDVLAALQELNFSTIRYPGGNFVSGYQWLDGVGPKNQRPRRRDLAWQSIETNQFGTDEFIRFCRKIKTEPMLGLNFGTAGVNEAANIVEYCNAPTGSKYSDMRAANGSRDPHGVKYWCLGNEMDGDWQIGHLNAGDYAKKALEAAKMMKWTDPSIRLISCGSSGPMMPDYPDWDRIVLEHCWEKIDYHSMHMYAANRADDTASYLASAMLFENFVDSQAATLRYAKTKVRSKHDVYLSWDEWNVWYKNVIGDGKWTEAPHLLEEIYNLEDALVVAQWLGVFLRKCDVLKIGCLAQVVNVIAPILVDGDKFVKQTIFYPFMFFRKFATGMSLDPLVRCPRHETKAYGNAPTIDVSVSHDAATGRSAVFLVNRGTTQTLPVDIKWIKRAPTQVKEAWQLCGTNPKTANTFDSPKEIIPRQLTGMQMRDGGLHLELPPLSFTVLAVEGKPS